MTEDTYLVRAAKEMLSDAEYREDARVGAPRGNSVVGSLLSLTLQRPRWATEAAVMQALRELGEAD